MANPKVGSTRSDGKVYAGQNYGYQSPKTFQKLATEGKFRVGTQALDRLTSSAGNALKKHAPGVVKHFQNVKADQERLAARQDRQIRNTAGNRVANAAKNDATGKTLDAVSKATNLDRRVVGVAATAAQAAISAKALKGGAAKPSAATKPATSTRANAPRATAAPVAPRPTASSVARRPAGTTGNTSPRSDRRRSIPKPEQGPVQADPNLSPAGNRRAARDWQRQSTPPPPVSDPRGSMPQRPPTPRGASRQQIRERARASATRNSLSIRNGSATRSVGAAARSDVAGKTGSRTIHTPAKSGVLTKKGAHTKGGEKIRERVTTYTSKNRVLPPRASQTKASSSPGIARNRTKAQTDAAAAKAARNSPSSTRNRGLTSGGTKAAKGGKEAAGPIKQGSPGNTISPGNSYTKEAPSNRALTRSNKERAVTNYGKKVVGKDLPPKPPKQNKKEAPRSARLDAQADNSTRNRKGWNAESSKNAAAERDRNRGNAYQPNSGRVNPRLAGKLNRAEDKAMSTAGKGLKGAERTASRNAARGRVRAIKSNIEDRAQNNTRLHQRHRKELAQDGTTRSSMTTMSENMVGKPRVQGPRRPATKTTGTNRVAANAKSGSASTKTPGGDVKTPIGTRSGVQSRNLSYTRNKGKPNESQVTRTASVRPANNPSSTKRTKVKPVDGVASQGSRPARTTDPKTGRPYIADSSGNKRTTTPSPNRKRGSNPAESRPRGSASPKPGSRQEANSKRAKEIKDVGEYQGRRLRIREEFTDEFEGLTPGERARVSPGLAGRQPQRGIRPADSRGSSTPTHRQGGVRRDGKTPVTTDNVQYRSDRDRTGKKVGRLGNTPQGKFSNAIDTKELRSRKAAAAKKGSTAQSKPEPIRQQPSREARLAEMRAQRAAARADKKAGRLTSRDSKAIQASVRADYNNRLPIAPGTNRAGEVRMDGSKKGNEFVSGVNSYNDPSGRIPKARAHDGTPTRVVGKPANDSRSSQGNQAAKDTMEKVRIRNLLRAAKKHKFRTGEKKTIKNAKPANTIKAKTSNGVRNAIDKRGNDLNAVMRSSLKANGF